MTVLSYIVAWLVVVGTYQTVKPLPENITVNSVDYRVDAREIDFLGDITYMGPDSLRVSEQEIFDRIFDLVDNAREYILIDMFLFNPDAGTDFKSYRKLSGELTDRLIAKRTSDPSIKIDFITDPINTLYGGSPSDQITALKEAGINVIITDLTKLRDSNPVYSSVWRTFFQWFGNSSSFGLLPHPLGKDDHVTVRSYLSLLNMKANHRKLIIADSGDDMVSIVTSANPHDGSSAHSNVALMVTGDIWKELYLAESAVAGMSNKELQEAPDRFRNESRAVQSGTSVRVVSEQGIQDALYDILDSAGPGDRISIAVFYLAERGTVRRLLEAADNGAEINMILDPNKDAFGREKNGIPNRPVARELLEKSDGKIRIRWYDTHGEQFHTKMVISEKSDGASSLLLGSANFTRRNLENFNLELNLLVTANEESGTINEAVEYFETAWNNKTETVDFEVFSDTSKFKSILYRIQEFAGLSSF